MDVVALTRQGDWKGPTACSNHRDSIVSHTREASKLTLKDGITRESNEYIK